MHILGINAFHGDASACLIRDGSIVAAAEEERFRRIKHWAGFPSEAIRYCLSAGGIGLGDVDHVAVNQDAKANLGRKLAYTLKARPDLALVLDPNTRDENGDTPLAVAAREGHAAIVDLLLEAGAKRSERSGGYPLLHHAAQGGIVRLTRKLLDEGQDPNLRADDGDTPLIDAAFGGHATTVALLLKRGADPTLANKKRRTALSYAKNAAVKALITAALKGRAPAHSRPRARRASTRA